MDDLAIQDNASNLLLTWTHNDAATDHYEVWRTTDAPYAGPGDADTEMLQEVAAPANVGDQVSYEDTTSYLGDADANHYYFVIAVDGSGNKSDVSNRVGEFDFGLVGQVPLPVVEHCGTINADESWQGDTVHRITCDVTVSKYNHESYVERAPIIDNAFPKDRLRRSKKSCEASSRA